MNDSMELHQKAIEEEIAACLEDMKVYEKQMKSKEKNKDTGFKFAKEELEKASIQLSIAREELKGLKEQSKEWEILHPIPEKEKKKTKQKSM